MRRLIYRLPGVQGIFIFMVIDYIDCFDTAICDLVQDVDTVFGFCSLLTASPNHV